MSKLLDVLASMPLPKDIGPVLSDGSVLFMPEIGSEAWRRDKSRINPKSQYVALFQALETDGRE